MRPRLIPFVLIVVVVALGSPGPANAASDGPRTGVWAQLAPVSPGGPLPPLYGSYPEGGLWLNTDPTDDYAVSALRFEVAPYEVPVKLTLRISSDRSTPAPTFALCPPKKSWVPPEQEPGPWEERPAPDCSSVQLDGHLADDGERVVFDLKGFRAGQAVDLVLTRKPGDALSVIDVTFDKPSVSDLVLAPPPSTGDQATGTAEPMLEETPQASQRGAGSGGFTDAPPITAFPTPEPDSVGPTDPVPAIAADELDAGAARADIPVASDQPRRLEPAWDTARQVALAILVALCVWIASIVSRQGGGAGGSFTLYRGTPTA